MIHTFHTLLWLSLLDNDSIGNMTTTSSQANVQNKTLVSDYYDKGKHLIILRSRHLKLVEKGPLKYFCFCICNLSPILRSTVCPRKKLNVLFIHSNIMCFIFFNNAPYFSFFDPAHISKTVKFFEHAHLSMLSWLVLLVCARLHSLGLAFSFTAVFICSPFQFNLFGSFPPQWSHSFSPLDSLGSITSALMAIIRVLILTSEDTQAAEWLWIWNSF